MERYVALLRGINLGRRNRVAMADLRGLLTGLGHRDVRTHLQSGNAVFGSAAAPRELELAIEDAVSRELGLDVRCLVRSRSELRAVIDADPFREVVTDGSRYLALFLSDVVEPALLAAHDPASLAPDEVRLGDRVVYHWCPQGQMAAPPVGAFIERHLKVAVTARNWNTVSRLGAMLDA